MRAAVFNGAERPITIEQVPDPSAAPGELVVAIAYCGICGSDVSLTSGTPFDYPVGGCFGHEFAGTVVEVGREAGDWRLGEAVACIPNSFCGHCRACAEGRPLVCLGGRPAFGFAQYTALTAAAAMRLPESLSLADGAAVEPMACGLRALRTAGLERGGRLLVLGAGAMALSLVWWARAMGAGRVVVASRTDERAELCHRFGADAVHAFDQEEPGALTAALGGAPDLVAECVGKPGMLNLALQHVRTGGTVIGMGMSTAPEPILPAMLTFKEARLVFPLGYSPAEFAEAVHAFDSAGFRPSAMVAEVRPLDQLDAAIGAMRAGAIKGKIHIDPRLAG